MRTETQMEQGNAKHIPVAPVFEQRECRIELIGWACLHCGSSVETSGRVLVSERSDLRE